MTSRHIIRLVDGALFWLAPGAAQTPHSLGSDDSRDELREAAARPQTEMVFAAPGQDVRLTEIPVASEEKKHLRKLLPFRLEEEVADDLAETHFAMRMVSGDRAAVALCSHRCMALWRELLEGLPVRRWIPEPLLLPWRSGEWCFVVEPERVLLRTGASTGTAIEPESLTALLQALLAEDGTEPDTVVIYGQDQAGDMALLPEMLRQRAQWRRGDLSSALLLGNVDADEVPGLLQGDYATRLPLAQWWRSWRVAALAVLGIVTLHIGVTYAEVLHLKRENVALRQAIEATYRSVNPRGNVMDEEKQLRNELSRLRGGAGGAGFTELFDRVGRALSAGDDVRILSVNYNRSAGEMRLNLMAESFQSVETVRSAMGEAGLNAVMESSSAQQSGVRARLRIGS